MGGFQGFRNTPKRNQLWRAVIEKKAADVKKTTLLSLHDGSKGMKHTRYFLMLPSIVKTLEAISHERLFQNQYSNTPWNWNGESRNKACSLLNAVLRFPFLITQVTAMKYLSS